MLRQDLIPSILQVLKYNFDQGNKNLCVYEIGKTFNFYGNSDKKNTGVQEERKLIAAISGDISSGLWKKRPKIDFYNAKGILESLLKELGLSSRIEYIQISNISYLHPGRSAIIKLLGKDDNMLGFIGEIHPSLIEKCKISDYR